MTEDDLLMLPPIDGLVHEIKGQETVSSVSREQGQEQKNRSAGISLTGDSWNWFLRCCEIYSRREKRDEMKVYPIDAEIVNTLKQCNINKMATCDIINSILRAFIEQNKDVLRQFFKEKKSLI